MEAQKDIQIQNQESKTWPKVAIIVLNWNGWRDTIECLESLQRITYPDYQVIVVDNGSTDDSVEKIKAWARGEIPVVSKFLEYDPTTKPVQWIEYDRLQAEAGGVTEEEVKRYNLPPSCRMVLICNGENLGFAAGNNVALRYVLKRKIPLILLLNNDTIVDPNFLNYLVATLESNPEWSAVGPKILYKDEPERIWYAGARLMLWRANAVHLGINKYDNDNTYSGTQPTDHISMCCLLARRELFETVGLLDEDFFFGHEDWAYSCVARNRGLSFAVNLNSIVYHKSGGSHSRGHPIYVYYYNKNRLLILKKYGSLFEKIFGCSFYFFSRWVKFLQLLVTGRHKLIWAEIKAIADFLVNRYGDYDRKKANVR